MIGRDEIQGTVGFDPVVSWAYIVVQGANSCKNRRAIVTLSGKSSVSALVLAAGMSRRFGDRQKLLEPVQGEPLIRQSLRPYREADLRDLVVVVGHRAEEVQNLLDEPGVSVVYNSNYQQGQSQSVRVGIERLEERGAQAALIGLGDMPDVSPETVTALLEEYRSSESGIVLPVHGGTRGNPVLFDRDYFQELKRIEGDRGGRQLLLENPVVRVKVPDPGIHRDVDRPEDLES